MSESRALILGCSGPELTAAEKNFFQAQRPWGFILFARNIVSISQVGDLTSALRETIGRPDAPVLIDQEGGRVQRIRPPLGPRYPSGSRLGAVYGKDRAAGARAAWVMSRLHAFDLRRCGISVDCLPVLDVPEAAGSNVIGDRAYGDDPQTVAVMGAAAAAGLKAGGVLPVMKHIPGHGRARVDTHLELAVVDAQLETLEKQDFIPFRALRDELMAMTAHVVYSAIDSDRPATASKKVIADIVRKTIGFDGLLMSDDVSMKALSGDYESRTRSIFEAGCDIVLHCNGIMDEMRDVVAAAPLLTGDAKRRTAAVEAAFPDVDGSDETALRQEFESLMAID